MGSSKEGYLVIGKRSIERTFERGGSMVVYDGDRAVVGLQFESGTRIGVYELYEKGEWVQLSLWNQSELDQI